MKHLSKILLLFGMIFSGAVYGMSDGDKVKYLDWLKTNSGSQGALAVAKDGCWDWGTGETLTNAKRNAHERCIERCESRCNIKDVNGTSKFIEQRSERTINFGGGIYSGDLANGVPHGSGTSTRSDGSGYSGQWKNGLPHGHGTVTTPNGEKLIGNFTEFSLNGRGKHLWPNGAKKYVGQFRDNKFHGSGTWFDLDNKLKITGEFRDGKAHGQGTATILKTQCKESNCMYKGQRFVGEFRNNK